MGAFMLTKIQAEIIQGIIGVNQNPEIVTIKNRRGVPKNYAYGLISGNRLDLDKLRDRQLLSFRRGYCEPQVTEKGLSVFRRFQILSFIEGQLSHGHGFVDEKICKHVNTDIQEVQNLLVSLQSDDLIAGEFHSSSDGKYAYRFTNVWITSRGQVALKTPDAFWNHYSDSQAPIQPQVKRNAYPIETRFSQVVNGEHVRAVAPAESIPESVPYMEAHIEALKALAQSMPEDRRSQVMAILNHLSQTVESPERRCA
jgi:hypothetical protein